MKVNYRLATPLDIPAIVALEEESFTDAWSHDSFESSLTNPFCEIIIGEMLTDTGNTIVAYAVMMCMYEQGDLAKIAVDANYRHRGIATELIAHLIKRATYKGVERIFLDVRASNTPAINLYIRVGFIRTGNAASFYKSPVEDSVKMRYDIV